MRSPCNLPPIVPTGTQNRPPYRRATLPHPAVGDQGLSRRNGLFCKGGSGLIARRGSPTPCQTCPIRGPIPAGAGEPTAGLLIRPGIPGLSPRVQGSHGRLRVLGVPQRSIPAGAGEPHRRAAPRHGRRVYPRGYGGAETVRQMVKRGEGLSPRVRGAILSNSSTRSPGGLSPRVRGSLSRLLH